MKKNITSVLLLLLTFTARTVCAQDIVVKKDGSTILTKVLEVNQDNIKYKKFSSPKGPTYTIKVADIMAINYENGDKDIFNIQSASNNHHGSQNDNDPRYIEKKADNRNAELINIYSKVYRPTRKIGNSDSAAKYCFLIWAMESNSLISNEDIELKIVQGEEWYLKSRSGVSYWSPTYCLNLTNKSDRTIYIDKANCFKIIDDGKSFCYYDPTKQTTVGHGSGSGASIGLGSIAGALGVGGVIGTLAGGVAIGGGSSSTISTTYSQQRIIAIPPHGSRNISEHKEVKKQIVEEGEYFSIDELGIKPQRGIVTKGEVKTYAEVESPWKWKYLITYSTENDFKTYSVLNANLYVHQIIGTGMSHLYSKKYLSNYDDSGIIIWDKIPKY